MIKGIIFDLDGTLLDTIEDINNALNWALEKHGFPIKNLDETKLNLGSGSTNLVKRSLPRDIDEVTLSKVHQDYLSRYVNHSNILTKPYDGIIEVLKTLKNLGYKLAIVSNKDDQDVKNLNNDKFEGIIEIAIGARKNKPIKPNSYLLDIALENLNLSYEEVVYIGDSDVDILTAKNAGLKMITVSWGFRPYEVLLEYQAENIINKPQEIIEILKEL